MVFSLIGLRHFGQVSFKKRSIDMTSSFRARRIEDTRRGTLPLLYCCLRPGPRKLKQTLPILVGFGDGSREDRLFGVLPELICYRHGQPRAPIPIPACIPWQYPSVQNCTPRASEPFALPSRSACLKHPKIGLLLARAGVARPVRQASPSIALG